MSEKSTIANGLAWLLEHLLLGLGSHARHLNMPAGLNRLIAARLMRLRLRVSQLLASPPVAAWPHPLHNAAKAPEPLGADQPRATRKALPTNFAWLGQVFPGTQVALARSQLAALLDDPQNQTLIASHPLLARSLRPLCHMLGLKTPFCLKLPRRPRSRQAATLPGAPPPAPRQPPTPRIFWRPAPPPAPMTPAEARYAAQRFLNPREFTT